MSLTSKRSPRTLSQITPGRGGTTPDDLVQISLTNKETVFVYLYDDGTATVWRLHPDFLPWSVRDYVRRYRATGPRTIAFLQDAERNKPLQLFMERRAADRTSVVATRETVVSFKIASRRVAHHTDLTLNPLRP
ncbi:MAG TPA: hypothetical protein VF597_03315 [Candidatus Saccharimonadales bacterium]|jgi:hypothetical protein